MNMIKNYKIHCISEALSPITHMMGSSGNESVLNREYILHNNVLKQIPVLSGNAIRHRMIREPGVLYLIQVCDLVGKLNIDQANYLFNGGSLTESSISENLAKIANMQELLPLIRLLGGSFRNQVVGGSLIVLRGLLICEENRNRIIKMIPSQYTMPDNVFRSSEDFIDQYQYTRGDTRKRVDAKLILDGKENNEDTNLMIYNGQTIIAGSIFYHGFILQNVSYLELGALLHSLSQWEFNNGTIGGSLRIGHGKLKMEIFFEEDKDFMGSEINIGQAIIDYIEHVDKNKSKIVDWLFSTFPKIEKKKGKKDDQKLENNSLLD